MAGIIYEYKCPNGHTQTEARRLKNRDDTAYCEKCKGDANSKTPVLMERIRFHPVKTTFKFRDRSSYKHERK